MPQPVPKKPSAKIGSRRLEAQDWVNAALVELADNGISGVRVESLARKLGVTKGSFYWHFKDRDALLNEMLQIWRRRATLFVMDRIEKSGSSPLLRLESLLHFPFASSRAPEGSDVELAIRIWGRSDVRAKRALNEIDELRMRFIANIFVELGFDVLAAEARATLVYAFMRVGASLPPHPDLEALIRCIAEAVSASANTAVGTNG